MFRLVGSPLPSVGWESAVVRVEILSVELDSTIRAYAHVPLACLAHVTSARGELGYSDLSCGATALRKPMRRDYHSQIEHVSLTLEYSLDLGWQKGSRNHPTNWLAENHKDILI